MTSLNLLKELNLFNWGDSISILNQTVQYLSHRSDKQLETSLKEKFLQGTAQQQKLALESIADYAYQHGEIKMLDVCERIISLNALKNGTTIAHVVELAKRETVVTPAPQKLTQTAQSLSKRILKSPIIHRILYNVVSNPVTLVTLTVQGYISILKRFPPTTMMEIQGYLHFFRTFAKDVHWMFNQYMGFFSTRAKAASATFSLALMFLLLRKISQYFHFDIQASQESSDRKKDRNLSAEAREGRFSKTEGRSEEKDALDTLLNGENPQITFLVAPQGSGKTQFAEGLAWDSVNNPQSRFYGKTVISVSATEFNSRRDFEDFFEKYDGHENDIVFFFDEGHAIGMPKYGDNSLLEYLKTKVHEKRRRLLFATTNKEFDQHIATNPAFNDRIAVVNLKPLSKEDVRAVLRKFIDTERKEADPEALDEIIHISETYPGLEERENPRKALGILAKLMNSCDEWKPKKISHTLQTLERDHRDLKDAIKNKNSNNPNWSSSEEGIVAFERLQTIQRLIESHQEKRHEQDQHLGKIKTLKSLQSQFYKKQCEVIHFLAEKGTSLPIKQREEAEKTFLFFKFIALPGLKNRLQKEVDEFEIKFEERIPLKIDIKAVRTLYPAPIQPAVPAPLPVLNLLPPLTLQLRGPTTTFSSISS